MRKPCSCIERNEKQSEKVEMFQRDENNGKLAKDILFISIKKSNQRN